MHGYLGNVQRVRLAVSRRLPPAQPSAAHRQLYPPRIHQFSLIASGVPLPYGRRRVNPRRERLGNSRCWFGV